MINWLELLCHAEDWAKGFWAGAATVSLIGIAGGTFGRRIAARQLFRRKRPLPHAGRTVRRPGFFCRNPLLPFRRPVHVASAAASTAWVATSLHSRRRLR